MRPTDCASHPWVSDHKARGVAAQDSSSWPTCPLGLGIPVKPVGPRSGRAAPELWTPRRPWGPGGRGYVSLSFHSCLWPERPLLSLPRSRDGLCNWRRQFQIKSMRQMKNSRRTTGPSECWCVHAVETLQRRVTSGQHSARKSNGSAIWFS